MFQIFNPSVKVFVGWYFSMEIAFSLPVRHFFNEKEISKNREELLKNTGIRVTQIGVIDQCIWRKVFGHDM